MNSKLPYRYIAIEGNIGAGKTSLAKIIATKFNTELVLEAFADNTFLPQFYEQPERYAFPLEMSFLAERYQQLKQEQEIAFANNRPLVADYIFEKSMLFAKVNLTRHELDLFRKFYELLNTNLQRPDLILFLKKDTDTLLNNISKRGRDYEKLIPATYLDNVTKEYLTHLYSIPEERILIVESNAIDFVEDPSHLRYLLQLVQTEHQPGVHSITFDKKQ